MSIAGSCLCGAVHYELTAKPMMAFFCHCSRCRKTRGSAFASNAAIGREAFRYTAGEDNVQSYKPPDAVRFTHAFCRTCGSSLPWFNEGRGIVVVPMGSLDDDPGITSSGHIFVDSKAPWFTIQDDLPQKNGPPGG